MTTMAFARTSFLGGEWSKLAQGRFDRPDYKTALNRCLNAYPTETGAWVRKPGTRFIATTRSGAPGRVIRFDFQAAAPYNMEFTDGHLRFLAGATLATTNDDQSVTDISTAEPAIVTTSLAHGWTSGDQIKFAGLGTLCPLLQNRLFSIVVLTAFTFEIFDAITGAAIQGSILGWSVPAVLPTVQRILDIATPWTGTWSALRSVQAEDKAVLLSSTVAPQLLTVTAQPTAPNFATFSLAPAVFQDGPYLDPPTNGAQITPSATSGIITATISFAAYDAAKSYRVGDVVVSSAINYQSLVDANINNTPASSPTQWQAITTIPGVNSGQGFVSTDVGRHIRLFSEPADWASGTTYAAGDKVTYNGVYWRSLVGTNSGHVPGNDTTNWVIDPTTAIWVWGTITAVSSATVASVQLLSPTQAVTRNRHRFGDLDFGSGPNNSLRGEHNPQRTDAATNQLLYTTPIKSWRLGLFSSATGYPTCGTYHEGRLWISGIIGNRIDGSVSNDLLNFAPTGPDGTVADNNAIAYTFNAPDVNAILWMAPEQQGIVCGTIAGEWLVQPLSGSGGITPTSIQAHRQTTIGCANVEPRRCGLTLVFVQRWGRKLQEYFADVFSGKFASPNLSERAKHLSKGGIAEIAFQQELTPIIWARRNDGVLIGATYRRESLMTSQGPNFIGWHQHALGSGRVVESLATGPNVAGSLDALTIVTNDPATNIRHVELLTDQFEEDADQTTAWFLDDAVTVPSTTVTFDSNNNPSLALAGLWHLAGKTVTVFAGGLDCGDYAVDTNGNASVPFADGAGGGTASGLFTLAYFNSFNGACPVIAGFTFTSDGQIVRPLEPQESGAQSGPALGKVRRTNQHALLLQATVGLSVGGDFSTLRACQFKDVGSHNLTKLQPFSGVFRDRFNEDYSFDGMMAWRASRPYPAIVVAVEPFLQTQES